MEAPRCINETAARNVAQACEAARGVPNWGQIPGRGRRRMMDGVLRVLIVALGLLFIWWLRGPAGQRSRPARRERNEARAHEAHVDTQVGSPTTYRE